MTWMDEQAVVAGEGHDFLVHVQGVFPEHAAVGQAGAQAGLFGDVGDEIGFGGHGAGRKAGRAGGAPR